MIFTALELAGVYLIDVEPHIDDRGSYARSWSAREFQMHGLNHQVVECGISQNPRRGTMRGLHLQAAPHGQAKLVRCSRGAIYDVVIDVRAESPTYCRWIAVDLSAERGSLLYIPEGCAHGFQTLADGTEVLYQMSAYHHPEAELGIRWNDPCFAIPWPVADVLISPKDRSHRDFQR